MLCNILSQKTGSAVPQQTILLPSVSHVLWTTQNYIYTYFFFKFNTNNLGLCQITMSIFQSRIDALSTVNCDISTQQKQTTVAATYTQQSPIFSSNRICLQLSSFHTVRTYHISYKCVVEGFFGEHFTLIYYCYIVYMDVVASSNL